MECQSCHARKATLHLCEQCAQAQQQGGMEIMGLLSSAFAAKTPAGTTEATDKRCPDCGLAYTEFRSRGRLGCPACYETFRTSLEPLLEKIHGQVQHIGKAPKSGEAPERGRDRDLVALRRKLQAAVKDENYELAAKLRDELRQIEGGEPE